MIIRRMLDHCAVLDCFVGYHVLMVSFLVQEGERAMGSVKNKLKDRLEVLEVSGGMTCIPELHDI